MDDNRHHYVNAEERIREVARQRAQSQPTESSPVRSPHTLHFNVPPTQRRSLDDPADREFAVNAALVEAVKHVGKAEAARVVDEWQRDDRLDRHIDGRVLCAVRCPTYDASFSDFGVKGHLASEWRTFEIADAARLLLSADNPEAEVRRRENEHDANLRAIARADAEEHKRHQAAMDRKHKLEARAVAWRNAGNDAGCPQLVRALLRNVSHPEHGAMFATLAKALLTEPHDLPLRAQPPECALALLGFDTSAVTDDE